MYPTPSVTNDRLERLRRPALRRFGPTILAVAAVAGIAGSCATKRQRGPASDMELLTVTTTTIPRLRDRLLGMIDSQNAQLGTAIADVGRDLLALRAHVDEIEARLPVDPTLQASLEGLHHGVDAVTEHLDEQATADRGEIATVRNAIDDLAGKVEALRGAVAGFEDVLRRPPALVLLAVLALLVLASVVGLGLVLVAGRRLARAEAVLRATDTELQTRIAELRELRGATRSAFPRGATTPSAGRGGPRPATPLDTFDRRIRRRA